MHPIKRYIGAALLGAAFCTAPLVSHAAENNRIDRWFVFGTNLAWFGNAYGTDIGPNHAEGWGTYFSREECQKVFRDLQLMQCPVVRIWAFERQEGLTFTSDLSTDPKYPYHEVTGLDETFLQNCDFIMETAKKAKVKVYWSLLNHLIREEQGGRHLRIITDTKVRGTYIRNALIPFVKRYSDSPALFAIDIINEADGTIGGAEALSGGLKPFQGCSWNQMRVFIKECADAIHKEVPGIKVTASSGWHGYSNIKTKPGFLGIIPSKPGKFSGLGLDFYDWHSYIDTPDLPSASELGLDKPCIIGECGPKSDKTDPTFKSQEKNWRLYFEQARKGYAGIMTWSYGNPGENTDFVMINKNRTWRPGARLMREYALGSKYPDAGPLLQDANDKACLDTVNEVVSDFRAFRDSLNGLLSAESNQRWTAFIDRLNDYYPYVSHRYALIVMYRIAVECRNAIQNLLPGKEDEGKALICSMVNRILPKIQPLKLIQKHVSLSMLKGLSQ